MTTIASMGSTAVHQGRLWGARARHWAEQEEMEVARFEAGLERVPLAPGRDVLELGCGSGVFLRLVTDRGARAFGLDAAEPLVELARERVPDADVRVGDFEALPYPDGRFDLVAGFNSFFFAADMTAALREAARVARPGGFVVIQVWGRPERCDLTPMLQAIRALARPEEAGRPRPSLSDPGVLERIATDAGLHPEVAYDRSLVLDYPDEAALLRRLLAPGGVVEAVERAGEDAVARAIVGALAPHRTASGGYRLRNEWRYLVARA
jgi:SAM-dependent methyltransferase